MYTKRYVIKIACCVTYIAISTAVLSDTWFLSSDDGGMASILSAPIISKPEIIIVEMNVSAYCPCKKCCGKFADGITASGHMIKPGDKFVAAPKNIPFGTLMSIPGYGVALVLDRGGAIKDNRLDVFFPTHQEALNWGRQYLEVKIKETNNE